MIVKKPNNTYNAALTVDLGTFPTREEAEAAVLQAKADPIAFLTHRLQTKRRTHTSYTVHNITLSASAWAQRLGLSRARLYQLAKAKNQTLEQVIEARLLCTPAQQGNP
jgi:hypothetical protein